MTLSNAKVPAVAPDLEIRVNTRRAELIAKLVALKNDTGIESAEARGKLKIFLGAAPGSNDLHPALR